jgi:hypothetical protein
VADRQVRLTWEEAEKFKRAAEMRGMSVSNWLRDIARKQARADLAENVEKPLFNGARWLRADTGCARLDHRPAIFQLLGRYKTQDI